MERKSLSTKHGHFSYLHWQERPSLPKLFFIHATGFNALTYRRNLEHLKSDYEIYAIDLRGHGFTQAKADPKEFDSWETYIQDLVSVIDKLDHPIILAGHSLGSMLCLAIASRFPHLASHLLMIEPIIMSPFHCKLWGLIKKFGFGHHLNMAKQASHRRQHFQGKQQILDSYKARGAFKTWPVKVIRDYIEGGTISSSEGITLTCQPKWEAKSFANTAHQTWHWLKQVKCKTSLAHATHSSTIAKKSLTIIRRKYPNIGITEYQSTHFIPMEKEDCIANLIAKLLN